MTRRHAFTLIELLVVMSIIALLISILLPALAAARETARNVQCLTNIRQTNLAALMYANDNDERLPANFHAAPSIADGAGYWYMTLGRGNYAPAGFQKDKSTPSDNALICPSDEKTPSPFNPGQTVFSWNRYYCSYGINVYVTWSDTSNMTLNIRTSGSAPAEYRNKWARLSQVTRPSNVMVLTETFAGTYWDTGTPNSHRPTSFDGVDWVRHSTQESAQTGSGQISASYIDGHASIVKQAGGAAVAAGTGPLVGIKEVPSSQVRTRCTMILPW